MKPKNKTILLSAVVASILVFWFAGARAQEANSLPALRNQIGGACPADLRRVSLINANSECDPGLSVSKACDTKYNAPSKAWQECYEQIFACRQRVDENNQTIYDYNDWIGKCTAAAARAKASEPQPGFAKVNSPDFSARLKAAEERNGKMEETNGKQQREFADTLERKRSDLQNAFLETARIRRELQLEREMARRAQLMRQLEEQEEQRAMMENVLGSFLQGFVSAYSSSLPSYSNSRSSPTTPSRGGGGGGGCTYAQGCEATR